MGNKFRDMGITAGIAAGIVIIVTMALCLIASVMMKDDVGTGTDTQGNNVATNADENSNQTGTITPDNNTITNAPEPTDVPAADNEPSPEPTLSPEPTPEPTPEASGIVVAIDAAHQSKGNSDKEPIGPGASEQKVKVSYGATGVSTGKPEYELTLAISLKLKEELTKRGFTVYMIRETNDVNIADSERAKMANENANVVLHIHGNATENEATKGVMAFCVSENNQFCSSLSAESKKLADAVTGGMSAQTGSKNWGSIYNDNLNALNYSEIPAAHVEVGYMTNREEDELLQTEDYQNRIVTGIADGLDLYFGK